MCLIRLNRILTKQDGREVHFGRRVWNEQRPRKVEAPEVFCEHVQTAMLGTHAPIGTRVGHKTGNLAWG